jgi:hypothetical protein
MILEYLMLFGALWAYILVVYLCVLPFLALHKYVTGQNRKD